MVGENRRTKSAIVRMSSASPVEEYVRARALKLVLSSTFIDPRSRIDVQFYMNGPLGISI